MRRDLTAEKEAYVKRRRDLVSAHTQGNGSV